MCSAVPFNDRLAYGQASVAEADAHRQDLAQRLAKRVLAIADRLDRNVPMRTEMSLANRR